MAELAPAVTTEFNIEGYPNEAFIELVLTHKPAIPCPDPGVLTSNAGWDTIAHEALLTEVIAKFKAAGIRTSVTIETNLDLIDGAKKVGADRIELYTEDYAVGYPKDAENAVAPYVEAAKHAKSIGLE